MRKVISIILLSAIMIVGAISTADAAKRKTGTKKSTAQSTATAITPVGGISIKTFCKIAKMEECGRIIQRLSDDKIENLLKEAGYDLIQTRTEKRCDDAGLFHDGDYTAYIRTYKGIFGDNNITVTLDDEDLINIKFSSTEDFNKFLAGCKAMGYRYDGDYSGLNEGYDYYKDGAKCYWAGTHLEVSSKNREIKIYIVYEA